MIRGRPVPGVDTEKPGLRGDCPSESSCGPGGPNAWPTSVPLISGVRRTSRPVSRVLCSTRLAALAERRPSIWGCCRQQPRAVYPQTRASSPRTSAQYRSRPAPLDLAPGGVYQATTVSCGAGGLLHHRFTLTLRRAGGRSALCCTFPRVTPGGCYPPPCSVEPGLSSAWLGLPTRAAAVRSARPPFPKGTRCWLSREPA